MARPFVPLICLVRANAFTNVEYPLNCFMPVSVHVGGGGGGDGGGGDGGGGGGGGGGIGGGGDGDGGGDGGGGYGTHFPIWNCDEGCVG